MNLRYNESKQVWEMAEEKPSVEIQFDNEQSYEDFIRYVQSGQLSKDFHAYREEHQ